MAHRIRAAVAAVAAAAGLAAGVAPAAAEAEPSAVTGWVVQTPDADGVYEVHAGSATIRLAGGATVSCPVQHGWGRAEAATLRPNDVYGETGVTVFGGCTGSPVAGLEVVSSPGMGYEADVYDASGDRVAGLAYPWMWGLFLQAPGCEVDLYPTDWDPGVPSTYDNRTATLRTGPFRVVVTRAEGAGCTGLAAVGDQVTYASSVVATPGFTVRPA